MCCHNIILKEDFLTEKNQSLRYREEASGYQWGEGSGEGLMWVGTGRCKVACVEPAPGLSCCVGNTASLGLCMAVGRVSPLGTVDPCAMCL